MFLSIFNLENNKRGNNMGGSSMIRSYFVQKDETERNFNNKKEPEPELVIYKGELVVTEKQN